MRNFQTRNLTKEFAYKARLLKLAGEEARIRILCVLMGKPGACVSVVAKELAMSIAAVSHHLQLMQGGGLVKSQRRGKQMCYRLESGKLFNHLRQFLCHKEQK